jgi:O-acetyl-ADP-ribose deacetylase (regulator of RNase III)
VTPTNLTLRTTSILDDPADILVCPVNCQPGVMGKGLALEFARKWPGLIGAHRYAVGWGMRPGRPFIERINHTGCRYVILFPTKDHWHDPSRLEWIESGLEYLRAKALDYSYWFREGGTVATPALGCGLGGLSFDSVRPLIERFAAGLPGVQVRLYPPKESS